MLEKDLWCVFLLVWIFIQRKVCDVHYNSHLFQQYISIIFSMGIFSPTFVRSLFFSRWLFVLLYVFNMMKIFFFCICLMVTRYFCVLKPIFDSIVNNNKNLAEWFVDLVMWKANIAKKRARDEISGKQKWYSNRIASEKKSVKMAEAGLRERTRVVTRNKNNIWY